ncbi:hypothetical protein NMG60_11017312 [Bertholletia excelsa]
MNTWTTHLLLRRQTSCSIPTVTPPTVSPNPISVAVVLLPTALATQPPCPLFLSPHSSPFSLSFVCLPLAPTRFECSQPHHRRHLDSLGFVSVNTVGSCWLVPLPVAVVTLGHFNDSAGKSSEGKERLLYEKKRKIREALEEGKSIPTELRKEEAALRQEIDLEDEHTAIPGTLIDDEYANTPEKDPKILLTTSCNPSAPLTQFVKELKFVFPNTQEMNRGGQVISEITETCRAHDFTDVVLVHEHPGMPDDIIISHLPFGPTVYFGLLNVVTRHDIKDKKSIGTMPEAYPPLILNNFSTKILVGRCEGYNKHMDKTKTTRFLHAEDCKDFSTKIEFHMSKL